MEIPDIDILDTAEKGLKQKDAVELLDLPATNYSKRIMSLQKEQAVLLQYRKVQNLHLTKLKSEILNSITLQEIKEAPLKDKIKAYDILNKAELTDMGKPTEIKGLLAYVVQIEKEKSAAQINEGDNRIPILEGMVEL